MKQRKLGKKIAAWFMCLAMVLTTINLLAFMTEVKAAGIEIPQGTGTSENPYQISTAEELFWFAEAVNNGNKSICAELTNNIVINSEGDLSPIVWTPIGTNIYNFKGTFDGQGYTIKGVYINDENSDYKGLFGCCNGSTIKDLTVVVDITGRRYVGGICGYSTYSTVENCSVSGNVTGASYVGGICGYLIESTVENCSVSGSVSSTSSDVGGICGHSTSYSTVENCSVSGNVTGASSNVGGIVGNNDNGSIGKCYNSGSVQGESSVGGICGRFDGGNLANCYNTGNIGNKGFIGGICGYFRGGNISKCYNLGTISHVGLGDYGSVIGYGGSNSITDCYYLKGTGLIDDLYSYGKTAEEFASGQVAYLLNDSTSSGELNWYQTIGTDPYPNFNSERSKAVYYSYADCSATEKSYSNSEGSDTQGNHDFLDKETGKYQSTCVVCGAENTNKCGENVYYVYDSETKEVVIYGEGDMTDYTTDYTTYAASPFYKLGEVLKVTIKEDVTSIGNYAFMNCSSLKTVTFAEGSKLEIIGGFAFEGTAITEIEIPASVADIGNQAFYQCSSLKKVTFAEDSKLERIWAGAFALIAITEIEIPASVTEIEYGVFMNCRSLETVTFAEGSKLENIKQSVFRGCVNATSIKIPCRFVESEETWKEGCSVKVTYMHNYSSDCDTTCNDCEYVRDDAPGNHDFNEDTVFTKIDENTHQWTCSTCGGVAQGNHDFLDKETDKYQSTCVVCGAENTNKCGEKVYYVCNSVIDSETEIETKELVIYGEGAMGNYINANSPFFMADYKKIIIENGVTTIGSYAFPICSSLTEITIPNSVTRIGKDAFSGCSSLTEITIPNSVSSIGFSAFNQSGLKEISIPASVTSMDVCVFEGCFNLTKVVFQQGCTQIGEYDFQLCKNLEIVEIPCSVKNIGDDIFESNNLYVVNPTVKVAPGSVAETYMKENYPDLTLDKTGSHNFENGVCEGCGICQSVGTQGNHDFSHSEYQKGVAGKHYQICALCQAESEKVDCTAGTPVRENEVAATCTVDGSYDEVTYCTVCEQELSRDKKTITKTGHKFTTYTSNDDATCTENATETATCENEDCGETDTREAVNSALGHDYAAEYTVDTTATCTTAGSKAKYCSRCEAKTDVTVIPATGEHTYEDGFCSSCQVAWTKTENGFVYTAVANEAGPSVSVKATENVVAENGKLVIPDKVSDGTTEFAVTEIAEKAFENVTGVTEVIIPETVETIGSKAFENEEIKKIDFEGTEAPAMAEDALGTNVTEISVPENATGYEQADALANVTIVKPSASPEPSEEVSASPEPSEEVSASPQPSEEVSVSPSPSNVPSEKPSDEPSVSPSPSEEVSASPQPSEEVSASPSPSNVPSEKPSDEPSVSPSPSEEVSASPEPSEEVSVSPSPSNVPSEEPSNAPDDSDSNQKVAFHVTFNIPYVGEEANSLENIQIEESDYVVYAWLNDYDSDSQGVNLGQALITKDFLGNVFEFTDKSTFEGMVHVKLIDTMTPGATYYTRFYITRKDKQPIYDDFDATEINASINGNVVKGSYCKQGVFEVCDSYTFEVEPIVATIKPAPSASPSVEPSAEPSQNPSVSENDIPTASPSEVPSETPSEEPSSVPSEEPSAIPSEKPSELPSEKPSAIPSEQPSVSPSVVPTTSPSIVPSVVPSAEPSKAPAVGDVSEDKTTNGNYKVTAAETAKKEVTYTKPVNKQKTSYKIPDSVKIDGVVYKITKIEKNAFKNNTKVKTIVAGKNIKSIGANAFKGCKKLKTLTIKSTKLTSGSVAKNAFKGITKATTIKVPKKKLKAYKTLLQKKGLSKSVKIKAI